MSMTIAAARQWVELPPTTPRDVPAVRLARVINSTGHELLGVEGETLACATAGYVDDFCGPVAKEFDPAPEFVTGDPFAVYTGVSCDIQSISEGERKANEAMAYTEARAVEMRLAAWLAANATPVVGATSLVAAVGLLEDESFKRYGGEIWLWLPRTQLGFAAQAGLLCCRSDDRLVTPWGTTVIPYSSGTLGGTQAVVTNTVFVTGRLTLFRGALQVVAVPQQPMDGAPYKSPLALAERIYVPLFDCFVAQSTITA